MVKSSPIFIGIILILILEKSSSIKIKKNGKIDIIVSMKEGVKEIHAKIRSQIFPDRKSRLNGVFSALTQNRDVSQREVLNFLNDRKIPHESFWVSNQVFIQNVDNDLLQEIQNFPGVLSVEQNKYIDLPLEEVENSPRSGHFDYEIDEEPGIQAEWGVEQIQATDAWELGWNGTGAKVGVIGTGARWTHIAIEGNFVGLEEYGWRDPYTNSQRPFDQNGQGTNAIGIISGSEASRIGVAWGAGWMACRGCESSSCGTAQLIACGQFFICPTNYLGQTPRCERAPHIVSNSWSDGPSGSFFDPVLQGWELSGIVGVFSVGNMGVQCSTISYPGNSPQVIAVGATTNTDSLAPFSGRGPVTGTGLIKPDCTAPGQSIRTSAHSSDAAYTILSGTAMACHHVAGTLALMYGINPELTLEEAKTILFENTERDLPSTGQNCGNVAEDYFPNNAFGWGRINAFNATLAVNETMNY